MKEYTTWTKEMELSETITGLMAVGSKLFVSTSGSVYMAEIQQPNKFKRFIK